MDDRFERSITETVALCGPAGRSLVLALCDKGLAACGANQPLPTGDSRLRSPHDTARFVIDSLEEAGFDVPGADHDWDLVAWLGAIRSAAVKAGTTTGGLN